MKVTDQKLFEDVLAQAGFSIVSNENGLYRVSHKDTDHTDFVQTNGYNFLASLRNLINSALTEEVLG